MVNVLKDALMIVYIVQTQAHVLNVNRDIHYLRMDQKLYVSNVLLPVDNVLKINQDNVYRVDKVLTY